MKSDVQPAVRKVFLKRLGWTLGFVVLIAWAWPRPFSYYSVCPVCAQTRLSTDWERIWSDHFTYRTTHRIKPTPVSLVLEKCRLIPQHEHQWLFGHGGGNGVKCAIGPGRHVRPTFESTNVAAFVEALVQHGDRQTQKKWLARMGKRELSHTFRMAVSSPPTGAYGSKDRFLEWLPEPEEYVADYEQMLLRESPKQAK